MVMTKRGIYHNLNESEYAISNSEVALFFSSRFYLNKFLDEYKNYRNEFKIRLQRSMNIDKMNVDLMGDIHLYRQIEKRGFRAVLNQDVAKNVVILNDSLKEKGELTWQELRLYALQRMIVQNTKDWCEMQEQK